MPTEHPAEFLRALLDAAPFGVVAMDAAGRIRLWSHGAQAILGWSEDELIGRFPPRDIDVLSSSNTSAGTEVRLIRNDGGGVEVKVWTAPWQQGTISVVMDN